MFKSIIVVCLGGVLCGLAVMAQTLPEMRMTPSEIKASPADKNQIGSSELAGVHTYLVGRAGIVVHDITPISPAVR